MEPTGPATPLEPAGAVEATTGAPVDALPHRVPVRPPGRWHQPDRPTGTPDGGEDNMFWLLFDETHRDGPAPREKPPRRPDRARGGRPAGREAAPHPIHPLPGLAGLMALSLVAAFFAWVSAAPIWLAVGHSTAGTAVIAECTGGGLTQHCRGIFLAEGGRYVAQGIRVSGVPAGRTGTGTALPARMTGAGAETAYADTGAGRHLRWLLGLLLVLACGAGIARCTGATRLPDRRERRWAVGVALAGPLLTTVGFLAAAW